MILSNLDSSGLPLFNWGGLLYLDYIPTKLSDAASSQQTTDVLPLWWPQDSLFYWGDQQYIITNGANGVYGVKHHSNGTVTFNLQNN